MTPYVPCRSLSSQIRLRVPVESASLSGGSSVDSTDLAECTSSEVFTEPFGEDDAAYLEQFSRKPRSSRRPHGRAKLLELVFCNITEFSYKAMHFLMHSTADAWCSVESHWDPRVDARAAHKLQSFRETGWITIAGPPEQSQTSCSGSHRGVLAGIKSHLHFAPLPNMQQLPGVRASVLEASSPYLVGCQMRLQGFDLWVFGSYHRGGVNAHILSEVARFTLGGKLPFVLIGDVNYLVDEVYGTGWPAAMQAEVIGTGEGTCRNSAGSTGRCSDYAFVSCSLKPAVARVVTDWVVPFPPHAAIRIFLRRSVAHLKVKRCVIPKPLPLTFVEKAALMSQAQLEEPWVVAKQGAAELAGLLGPRTVEAGPSDRPVEISVLQAQLGQELQDWCLQMELWALSMDGVNLDEHSAFKHQIGRGRFPRWVWAPASVNKRQPVIPVIDQRVLPIPGGVNAPCRCAMTIALVALRVQAAPADEIWRSALLQFLSQGCEVMRYFWQSFDEGQDTEFLLSGYRCWRAACGKDPLWHIRAFVNRTAALEKKLLRNFDRTDRAAWKNWAEQALRKGASAAHSFSKAPTAPFVPEPRDSGGGFSKDLVAKEVTKHWSRVWHSCDEGKVRDVLKAVEKLAQAARESDSAAAAAGGISLDSIRGAALSFARKTAIGGDGVEFQLLGSLPDVVLEPFVQLLQQMVRHAVWAPQLALSFLVLLPKKLGGFRTIAIMSSLCRVVLRILCGQCRAWDAEWAVVGDSAAQGKNAATEVAKRFLLVECAHLTGSKSASIFWDVAQFYDSIDILQLVRDIAAFDFPQAVAAMALQAHVGDRVMKIDNAFGPIISGVGRSILAGCSSSTSFARLFLTGPLREVQAHSSDLTLGVHVDDVSQTMTDCKEQHLFRRATSCGIVFAKAVSSRGLQISNKSVVVSSSISLSRRIASKISGAGFTVKPATWTEDLGIGFRPGRRTAVTIKNRLSIGLVRASRASLLRRAAGTAAGKLFNTGVKPAATFGQAASGLSARQRATLLSAARKVAGPGGFAPCSRTLVQIRLGVKPPIQAQTEQIRLWWNLWQSLEDRPTVTKAWRSFCESTAHLSEARSWEKATGPIAATVLTVRAAGWQPVRPDLWLAPGERAASLGATEPHALHDIVEEIANDLEHIYWRDASKHFAGEGLEQGPPCFAPYLKAKKYFLRLGKKQKAEQADGEQQPKGAASAQFRLAALEAVVAGGATVGSRFSPPRACPRCQKPDEDAFHRYFGCVANQEQGLLDLEPAIGKTEWLRPFLAGAKQQQRPFEQCLWARGILPASRITALVGDFEQQHVTIGNFAGAAASCGEVFTDGSGGPQWIVPPLRRVGAGGAAVQLSADPLTSNEPIIVQSVGLIFASVPGRQTVPRAETWAGSVTLAASPPTVRRWWVDAAYTVGGARPAARRSRTEGANGDVWVALLENIDTAPQLPGPSKVKAHLGLDDVLEGKLSFLQYFGNSLADTAADAAAARYQHPMPALREAEISFATAVLVCRRLAAIEASCWQATADSKVPMPEFDPIPVPVPVAERVPAAKKRVLEHGHRLYRFKSGFACQRCQRWRNFNKAQVWAAITCLPRIGNPGPRAEAVAGQHHGPGEQVPVPQRYGNLDVSHGRVPDSGGSHASDGDLRADDSQEDIWFEQGISGAVEEAEAEARRQTEQARDFEQLLGEGEPEAARLVSFASAQAARRRQLLARRNAAAQDRLSASAAASSAARDLASDSHCEAVARGATVAPEEFPPWAARAHLSHDLLTLGGIVGCAFCGSFAARDITHSRLTKVCPRRCTPSGRLALLRFLKGKLPRSNFEAWPDGGFDVVRNGAQIRRFKDLPAQ